MKKLSPFLLLVVGAVVGLFLWRRWKTQQAARGELPPAPAGTAGEAVVRQASPLVLADPVRVPGAEFLGGIRRPDFAPLG